MENYAEYFKIAKIFTNVHSLRTNKSYEKIKDESNSVINIEAEYSNSKLDFNSPNRIGLFAHSYSNDFNLQNYKNINKSINTFNITKFNNEINNKNIKYYKDNNIENINIMKPNLNNFASILKSNLNKESNENIIKNSLNFQENFENDYLSNQTPKSKKDEIKKWLNRL